MEQASIFDYIYETKKIKKPIRLIELFAGYGSQNLALKYLGVDYKHYKICEWATKSIQAYNDLHIKDYKDYSNGMSKDDVIEYLFKKGISLDYNEPMTLEQIKRKDESWIRNVYNNIIATNNLVNIQQVHANDLEIVDTNKYEYIMTYSFPCQDLSLAGLSKGMSKGSGTRSGMLWEVERILDELHDSGGNLPQILLMENVPQVIGKNSIKDFQEWELKLSSLGYKNYVEVLNSKNYGIPQNRERCFMISILGEYNYKFPLPIILKYRLKNLLEKNVDEKYYLSDELVNNLSIKSVNDTATTICLNSKGGRKGINGLQPSVQDRVYSIDGISTAIVCSYLPNILIKDKVGNEIPLRTQYKKLIDTVEKNELPIDDVKHIDLDNCKLTDNCGTLTDPKHNNNALWDGLRIRKLTPKECFRLMGVKDEDFINIEANQSQTSLYHLAGDSIVTTVLMGILGELLDIDYVSKIKELIEEIKEQD